ncbi:GntR family transcriptional regulator [Limnochorda pilosa]|uniref:GntR family transcriptional regulator n=1 Tax=Limnochorda pilosa TaxID=1555112 RepID=A0A0K2SH00_LIMPI|nr:GntR family transcriptional regulator [Limnochorda pilosa]BAS26365.1 GntR family transcriptional regulator [Limnochorda pilosa]
MAVDDALTNRIYAELKREIQRGVLKPGDRLVERSIAEQKHVSRTPVREALRRLHHDGLAEHYPRRGIVVAALSMEEIDEIYALREALEGLAAREAAKRVGPTALEELHGFLRRMEVTAATGQVEEIRRLNSEYHDRIIGLSGMSHLARLVTQLRDRIEFYRRQSLSLEGRPDRTVEEHRLLLDTLKQGDPDLAEAAMRLHIRRARDAAHRALASGAYGAPQAAAGGMRKSRS